MKNIRTTNDYQVKILHNCYTPTVIADTLKEHNIQLTRQRQEIITGMCSLRKVADAESLWMYLRHQRKVSVASVYSTLKILIQLGIVFKNSTDDTRKASYQMACLHD
jgi:Fe2+ or Zn2+ uptake regulation protein